MDLPDLSDAHANMAHAPGLSDLSDDYANMAHIPGGEGYPAGWAEAAAAFRARHPPADVPYGEGARERLHLWRPGAEAKGLLVFVHGGYWMRFSASEFSHLASGPLGRGWAVAMPSYPLCPEARVGGIVRAVARAADRAAGLVGGPVALAGHSAGGQVVARLAGGDVALGCRGRLARVLAISPLANLLPLRRTGMNPTLGLDVAEALAESPMLRPTPAVPVAVWVGEAERPAFRDQARWLARAWGAPLTVAAGRHHLDVIDGLGEPDHPLARAATDG